MVAGTPTRTRTPTDPEAHALATIMRVLAPLDAATKRRVVKYVADKFDGGDGAAS